MIDPVTPRSTRHAKGGRRNFTVWVSGAEFGGKLDEQPQPGIGLGKRGEDRRNSGHDHAAPRTQLVCQSEPQRAAPHRRAGGGALPCANRFLLRIPRLEAYRGGIRLWNLLNAVSKGRFI